MKRPNITPGDWKTNEHGRILANGATLLVKGVALPHYTSLEIEANAHAIAAVPKLLAALESCLLRLDHHDAQSAPECLQARAALIEAGYTFD
jgi:hypothetical protein